MDAAAQAAVDALASGHLAVIPTDTVYGLAASLDHPVAIAAIFRAKNRPSDMPLPVLVASVEDAQPLVESSLESHEDLLREFWPGALTVIVPRSDELPGVIAAGMDTIGLRLPDSDIARQIIAACGGALATTSANFTTQLPAREVAELAPELLAYVAVVIDGGPCAGGTASTVIDLTASPPQVLRDGPISRDNLRRVLPDLR